MFFVAILLWGMAIGWIGQMILGRGRKAKDYDWLQALIAGGVGSLVGGTLGSVLTGEGFEIKMGGIIASIVGAVIVLAIWYAYVAKRDSK